jgi:sigma-E factor negative regulatory protein RseC
MQAGCIPAGWKGEAIRSLHSPNGVRSWVLNFNTLPFKTQDLAPFSGLQSNGVNGMREQGVVTRVIPPDVVEVSLQASEACGRCGACRPASEGRVGIEAAAVPGVKTGDVVEIEISTEGVVATSFVVYLLPVVFLIAGYIFGSVLAGFFSIRVSGEMGGIVGAILFCVVSFGVIRLYDRDVRRRGTLRARVTRILPAA